MSYVKNYTATVPFSKTVTYGKSETGGSMTVSGSVPVNIELYVDTAPFEASVVDCNAGINVLAGSVAAMNSAQVSQIQQNAEEISSHVTSGFFSMIKSEISQNMAALYSRINSSLGLITEKTQQLEEHKATMENDYNRVKSRYCTVFQNLDDECYRRVVELDRQAFMLSNTVQKEQIGQLQSKQVAAVLLGFNEDELLQLQVRSACLNKKTQNAMQALHANVVQEKVYSQLLDSILKQNRLEQIESQKVPVVFMEADSLEDSSRESFCYGPDVPPAAGETVKQFFIQNEIAWHKAEQKESEALSRAFNAAAEKSLQEAEQSGNVNAKRIYETIMALRLQDTMVN